MPAVELDSVDRYEIVRSLGQGAFGQVFAARDPQLDRHVAIKLLHAQVTTEVSQQRLRREARALASVQHPNVVQVYDVGVVAHGGDERVFVAMELVDGRSLDAWNEEQPRPAREVMALMREVASGLHAVHAAGLVHRDLKPGNVLVGFDGRPRVADFGLARSDPQRPTTSGGWSDGTASSAGPLVDGVHPNLTQTGALMGTPAYMAPEQMIGEPCTPRSDQFAFFVVLHELLLGDRPFGGSDIHTLRGNVLRGRRRALPSRHGLPVRWVEALDRGLTVDPDQRFESMLEVLEALRPPPTRWRAAAVAMGAIALGAAVLAPSLIDSASPGCDEPQRSLGPSGSGARLSAVEESLPADVASGVVEALQTQRDLWVTEYARACALPRSDERRDGHLACLGDVREEFDETTLLLSQGAQDVVEGAADLVRAIRSAQTCRGELETVTDASPRTRRMQQRLARAKVLQNAGRYDAAGEVAAAVVAEIEDADDPKLTTDAWHRLGMIYVGSSQFKRGADALSTSYFVAQRAGLDRAAARASVDLIGIVGGAIGDTEAGTTWGRHALNHLQRLEDPGSLAAMYEQRMGELQWARGDFEAGRDHLQRAVELAETRDPDDPDLGLDRMAVALMSIELGEYAQAETMLSQALVELERAYGPNHSKVGSAVYNLGVARYQARKMDEARGAFERAKTIVERSHGPDDLQVNAAATALASIAMAQGRNEEARDEFVAIVRRLERGGELESLGGALAYSNLSIATRRLGEPSVSLQYARQGLEIAEKVRPATHPEVGSARQTLARALAAIGRRDEAITEAERARTIAEEALPKGHPMREEAAELVQEIRLGQGRSP